MRTDELINYGHFDSKFIHKQIHLAGTASHISRERIECAAQEIAI